MSNSVHACEGFRNLIPLRVSDDLSVEETALVDGHVRYCKQCRDELAVYTNCLGVLREAAPPIPLENHPSLWNRIEPRLGPAGRMRQRRPPLFATWQLAAAACALFALVLVREMDQDTLDPPIMAQVVDTSGQSSIHKLLGIEVQPLNSSLARRLGLRTLEGALINEVYWGAGRMAGLDVHDVIVELQGNAIESPNDLIRAIEQIRDRPLLRFFNVKFIRGGRLFETNVRLSPDSFRSGQTMGMVPRIDDGFDMLLPAKPGAGLERCDLRVI